MQLIGSIPYSDKDSVLCAILEISKQFRDFSILNSNSYEDPYGKYELLCGFGCFKTVQKTAILNSLGSQQNASDWIFLHATYDLKNQFESLDSYNPDHLQFEDLSGFVPEHLLQVQRGSKEIQLFSQKNEQGFYQQLKSLIEKAGPLARVDFPKVKARVSKEDYLQKIHQLKEHIQKGDIYEANFCMEFYAEDVSISPELAYYT